MRQIANNVYIPVLKDLVEEGKEVSIKSMFAAPDGHSFVDARPTTAS